MDLTRDKATVLLSPPCIATNGRQVYGAVRIGQANEYSPSRSLLRPVIWIYTLPLRIASCAHWLSREMRIHTCMCTRVFSRTCTKSGEGGRGKLDDSVLVSPLHSCPPLFNYLFFCFAYPWTLWNDIYVYFIYIYGEIFWRGILIVGNIRSSSFLLPSLRDDSIGINRWKLLNPLFLTLISYRIIISLNYLYITSKILLKLKRNYDQYNKSRSLKFQKDTTLTVRKIKDRYLERILIRNRCNFEKGWKQTGRIFFQSKTIH